MLDEKLKNKWNEMLLEIAKVSDEKELAELSKMMVQTCGWDMNFYKSPKVVSVALVPVIKDYKFYLLGVVRNIAPKIGEQAFAGGFVNTSECAKDACARETQEETGITLEAQKFEFFEEHMTPHNILLQFYLYKEPLAAQVINMDFKNEETQCLKLLDENSVLCFDLHQKVLLKYFKPQLKSQPKP